MFSFVTAPPFFLGFFRGMENRKNNPVSDPWVAYKLAACSIFLTSLRAFSESTKVKPVPRSGMFMIGGAFAGFFLAGGSYYIGNKLGEEVPRDY